MLLIVSTIAALAAPVKVVVFPDRAQVTRTQEVACGPRKVASFVAIPPSADRGTIRAQTDVGTVDGLRVESRPQAEAFSKEAREVEAALEEVDGELRELADARDRDQVAIRMHDDYARVASDLVGREMTEPAPNLKAWQGAFDAALKARLAAAAEAEKLATKRRVLEHKRNELQRKRARLASASARSLFVADALISCPAGKHARVQLTYVVGGASWSPTYVAREGKEQVELTTWATVTQSTGEDWKDAEIILSTALPRDRATPPDIAPLKVWAEQRQPPKKVIVGRQEYQAHAQTTGGETAGTAGRLRVSDQGLSVQLAVPDKADVVGDGTPARLEVGRVTLKAPLRLRTVPKSAPFVFRVAEVMNAAPLPLLPGPVDVFRRGDFIARYELERVAQGARFDLTFGLEEAVKVKRVVVEELKRDEGILGPSRRRRFAYRFEVVNHLTRAEEVELSEHVPVSELDDVKVGIDPKSTSGWNLRSEDGIVTWKVKLAPGEKRVVELRYYVDVPAAYDSGST
jgi:uncharacterized protein (TIGR02231 family)